MSILSVVCFSGNVSFDMKRIVQTIIMIVFMTEKLVTSVVYSYSTIGIVASGKPAGTICQENAGSDSGAGHRKSLGNDILRLPLALRVFTSVILIILPSKHIQVSN